jgi:hypothetical protein
MAYGWGWNPFARSGSDVDLIETADNKSTAMLNGKKIVRPISSSDGPSIWSRIASTPGRMMSGLKRALTFGGDDDGQVVSKHGYANRGASKKRKSGWFTEEPSEPRTPQEWLAQERPDPFK